MMPDNPLSQLRDIHLPQTGGFWPPAPGWWLLAAVFLIVMAALAWLVHRHYRRNLWLKLAKAELSGLERSAVKEPQWFAMVNSLLKRVARERYPGEHPEALSGEQWGAFLLNHLPDGKIAHQPIVEALINSTWQRQPTAEPVQVLDFARSWLEAQKC